MPHIVPLKGIYRKKKQVKITNSTSSPLFDYQAQVNLVGINFDSTSMASTSAWLSGTPISWSHTCSGNNRYLVVYTLNVTNTTAVTSVTYGGIPMTRIINDTSNFENTAWVLKNPPVGTNTVTVNFSSGSTGNVFCSASSYTGVKDFENVQFVGSGTLSSHNISVIASNRNSWVVGCTTYASAVGDDTYTNAVKRGVMNSAQGGRTWDSNGVVTNGTYTVTASGATQSRIMFALSLIPETDIFNETGLVASYHFNEGSGTTAKDSSPNKNDGTITNGTYVPGQFGTALSFNGSSTTVLKSSPVGLPTGNMSRTYISSFRKNDFTSTSKTLFQHGTAVAYQVPAVYCGTANKLAFDIGAEAYDINYTFSSNTQYQIAVTTEGQVAKFYVNGVYVDTHTYSNTINTGSSTLGIGCGIGGTNNWDGTIDFTQFFVRALTPQEILDRYNASIRPDYLDLRFMDGQNKLKHWIEQDGKAWVKVPQIPANSSKTIDMYYGNYSALDVQDKDGLVAYYPLDGNSKDFAGGNHGVDSGVTYVAGKYGQACAFNNNSIKMSDTSDIDVTTRATFSFWYNQSTTTNGIILSKYSWSGGQTNQRSYRIERQTSAYPSAGISLLVSPDGSTEDLANNAVTIPYPGAGSWHHVVFTYDGTNLLGYSDGVLQSTKAYSSNIFAGTAPLFLGNFSADGTTLLGGITNTSLDDLRIYNRALSSDEIKSLYNQGLTTTISEKPEAVKGFVGKLVRFIATVQQNVSNFFLFFR